MPHSRTRSAANRIALLYGLVFLASILLLGTWVYITADADFRRQRDAEISAEIADLMHEGDASGVAREIAERQERRTLAPFGYALFDRAGHRVAGAMDTTRPPPGFGMIVFRDPREGPDPARAEAVDVPGGERLVVAVDSEAIETIDATILTAFATALAAGAIIALGGALLLRRYLRRRLGGITRTAERIVAGDLDRRMPVGTPPDEFDAVADALNVMLDRIAGLMENLRQVSSDVAHDLRTPLLRLRGELERLEDDPGAAARALRQGDAVLELFAGILRIAEVEGGGLAARFVDIDLSATVNAVAEGYLPALADGGRTLTVATEPGVVVRGSGELLAQALANLLDNVRVHTPPGTRAEISLESDGALARIVVRDNGPGIGEGDLPAVTRRFYRAEASRATPGHGLGLSLVAAVAATHRGDLLIEGAPGTRVTLTLPLVRNA